MAYFADFHIHSVYSRATARSMTPEDIRQWAQRKGLSVIGTGDFTHPEWFREMTASIEEDDNGLYRLKRPAPMECVPASCRAETFFIFTAEVCCIYRKGGKTRKIHFLLIAPDIAAASRINGALSRTGHLDRDGRPILRLDAKELLRICQAESPESILVPAHVWTPHFSLFGAVAGFDSLEECFEERTPEIPAVETGLSSDPAMNRRLSILDGVRLLSNSDAHSPSRIGREANRFAGHPSFEGIRKAIRTGEGLLGTIECFPELGKYHHDGHRACGIRFSPDEAIRAGSACPVCGRRLTVGVLHRVLSLADRPADAATTGASHISVIPLPEILAETLQTGPGSRRVHRAYQDLLATLGNEFHILLDASLADIAAAGGPLLADAVARVRAGRIRVTPGFDGVYGGIRILDDRWPAQTGNGIHYRRAFSLHRS